MLATFPRACHNGACSTHIINPFYKEKPSPALINLLKTRCPHFTDNHTRSAGTHRVMFLIIMSPSKNTMAVKRHCRPMGTRHVLFFQFGACRRKKKMTIIIQRIKKRQLDLFSPLYICYTHNKIKLQTYGLSIYFLSRIDWIQFLFIKNLILSLGRQR